MYSTSTEEEISLKVLDKNLCLSDIGKSLERPSSPYSLLYWLADLILNSLDPNRTILVFTFLSSIKLSSMKSNCQSCQLDSIHISSASSRICSRPGSLKKLGLL